MLPLRTLPIHSPLPPTRSTSASIRLGSLPARFRTVPSRTACSPPSCREHAFPEHCMVHVHVDSSEFLQSGAGVGQEESCTREPPAA